MDEIFTFSISGEKFGFGVWSFGLRRCSRKSLALEGRPPVAGPPGGGGGCRGGEAGARAGASIRIDELARQRQAVGRSHPRRRGRRLAGGEDTGGGADQRAARARKKKRDATCERYKEALDQL